MGLNNGKKSKTLILLTCILLIVIFIIGILTGWFDQVFESKYEKVDTAYGGINQEEVHALKGKIVEFEGEFNKKTDIIIELTDTDDEKLFDIGDEIIVNTSVSYWDASKNELIFDNDLVPIELQVKVGDEVIVEYYWSHLQFEYSNIFHSSLITKDGKKYLPQGCSVKKIIKDE